MAVGFCSLRVCRLQVPCGNVLSTLHPGPGVLARRQLCPVARARQTSHRRHPHLALSFQERISLAPDSTAPR